MSEPCFKFWRQEDGNTQGHCCCSCRFLRPISSHPWNKKPLTKGPITNIIGYGCTVPDMPNVTFFDTGHGMCELYTSKDNVVEFKRVK